jgi:hypothetical protein
MRNLSRLPRNFHMSFKPERQYLAAMLRFAASGGSGTFQEIGKVTGIPMGTSSGKVPAILDYGRGMGLLKLLPESTRSSTKSPLLTQFGRTILQEDPFLKCEVTQWLAHFNMCRPTAGADVWYRTFFEAASSLAGQFQRSRLEEYLGGVYAVSKGNAIGPMVGMYEDEAAFRSCGAIAEESGLLRRRRAPIADEFALGYSAWMLQMVEDLFPGQNQVPVTELDRKGGWRKITGWSASNAQAVLDLLSRKGSIAVDRNMDPWLIQPRVSAEKAWRNIFDDMI